ncbi:CPBP family intramembrane glutamic endopeptidase [Aquimarina sp. 2201CG5-10]|uniref:CPBP family intramembrane glutamic endopeptidase n=1 Tax=Aquimarina callyspongiae TaxID=3098150 RepID=UPI002AB4BFBB|nr:CPBP family intramembrane glutamic endopeptidase [Aquimarina sp. 2201CG5-10]MDY8135392.1 CPBP family intramembrane glutamic endopeptidase [Aquimarina sp. 2201CG5-10]
MLGVLVVFIFSWVILWLFSKEHITALGIIPNSQRLREFFLGLIVMALFCVINLLGQSYFKEISYVQNQDYGLSESLSGIWWTFKAALFEELIFRGAILYLLIKKIGNNWACIISAIAFGIYHWFSYQMLGRGIVPMIYVFLLTGAGGWMFAYAFAKTKSLFTPLGLHFGWIVISIVLFSAGPLGNSLFIIEGEAVELGGWEQLLFFLLQAVIIPGIVTWYLVKKYRSSHNTE